MLLHILHEFLADEVRNMEQDRLEDIPLALVVAVEDRSAQVASLGKQLQGDLLIAQFAEELLCVLKDKVNSLFVVDVRPHLAISKDSNAFSLNGMKTPLLARIRGCPIKISPIRKSARRNTPPCLVHFQRKRVPP